MGRVLGVSGLGWEWKARRLGGTGVWGDGRQGRAGRWRTEEVLGLFNFVKGHHLTHRLQGSGQG
jgi:hypothetical protein